MAGATPNALRDENEILRSELEALQIRLKEAEQSLEGLRTGRLERERFLAEAIENATTAFGVGAPDGSLIFFNRAFAELTGYSREELEQRCLTWATDLTPPEWRKPEAEILSNASRTGQTARYQKEYLRKDGSRVPIELTVQPVLDGEGKVVHYRSFITDITARKRQEAELVNAHERTTAILESIADAFYSLDDQWRFVVVNPAAQRAPFGRPASELLGKVIWDVFPALPGTRIHQYYLDAVEYRTHEHYEAQSPLNHRWYEVFMFPRAGGLDVYLRDIDSILVNADWNRLTQVVGNLLQNAAKFTGRGGATSVTVRRDAQANRAVIQVTDTGIGIAPPLLAQLFQPFMQADQTLDHSQGGLGLGLALVKGLVELHGGDVSAESAGLGQGATFEVRLPLANCETAALQLSVSGPRTRRRILIIEDNIDAADTLREALEFCEHEVEVAYSGPDGIERARQIQPNVVLCDIGLPGMDGYQVARALRADDSFRGLFLVALSGYALPQDLQQALEAGFDHHLAKPPSLEQIEELLQSLPRASGTP